MSATRRLAVLAVSALLVVPAAASGATPGQINTWLNQQRAANGLPGVSYSEKLHTGCELHNRYMLLNNNGNPAHGEIPGRPGYTTLGANPPGEVLASPVNTPAWSATRNPWMYAPIHLGVLFNPETANAGGADSFGFRCGRTDTFKYFYSPRTFLYAGPRGPGRVPTDYLSTPAEVPYVPQVLVGIPSGRRTGPQLLVFANGLGSPYKDTYSLRFARIASKRGAVDLRVLDGKNPRWAADVRNGALLIPVHALRPRTIYVGQVVWAGSDGRSYPQTFFLKTEPRAHAHLDLSRRVTFDRRNARLGLRVSGPARGRKARVRSYVKRHGRYRRVQSRVIRLRGRTRVRVRWHYGRMKVRVSLRAFKRRGVPYYGTSTSYAFPVRHGHGARSAGASGRRPPVD